ncbi:MAG: type IV secretion protein DotH [Alphaproteobacteria bacterium]|nr:type IV secretion protein DotH [Alphaproteobacteria bacterium]
MSNGVLAQVQMGTEQPSPTPMVAGQKSEGANKNLSIPNFFEEDPGMSLNAEEGLKPGASPNGPPAPPEGKSQVDFDFEKSQSEIEKETRRQAFDNALQGILPLKPAEIRELLEHFDRTQESVELPVYPAPKPEIAVQTLSLDPGVKPAVIKVAYGQVTTVNILDVTGAPWPIEDMSWAGNFELTDSGSSGQGSHIIRITPQSEFATGNMSIRLLTLKTPLILSIETSRDIVHYRFDAIIPEFGPLATTPLIDKGMTIQAGSPDLAVILQGVAPEHSVKLEVSGVDGRTTAYKLKGLTYLRTPLTLLSPSWSSSVSSADGMSVYELQDAPVLLLSDKGTMVRARVSERRELEDLLDE